MTKTQKSILILSLFIAINSQAQTRNLGFNVGYSTYGLNIENIYQEYRGEMTLAGNRYDLGVDYTFPIINRKTKDFSLLTGTLGLNFNNQNQQGHHYSKLEIPLKVNLIFGNRLKAYAGFGINISKVIAEETFADNPGFQETQRSFQLLFTSELGLGYSLDNGHEICLFGIYREGLNPLYSNVFENIRLNTPVSSSNLIEISTGFFLSYKIPVGLNLD